MPSRALTSTRQTCATLLAGLAIGGLVIGCADKTPPRFDVEDELEVTDLGPTVAAIQWPEATDDHAVTEYRVILDGAELVSMKPHIRNHRLEALDDHREYVVEILALDAAGNRSSPLLARFETPDGTPPAFPEGAALHFDMPTGVAALAEGPAQASLRWPGANDSVGVAHYRVLKDGKELALADPTTTSFQGQVEDAIGHYQVEACDEANNCTTLAASYPDFRLTPTTDSAVLPPPPSEPPP